MLTDLGEEGRVLAGGQSLVPLMNFRLAQPAHLVDINPVEELDYVRVDDGSLAIGARLRQADLERSDLAARSAPLLVEALGYVGHPPLRHRGTVCGSVAHADPAAEVPAVLTALDAEVVVAARGGERRVPAVTFASAPFMTVLQPGELVKEVRIPIGRDAERRQAFVEVNRRHGDFAVAGAAVSVEVEGATLRRAAIGLCAVAGTPVRATRAEEILIGGTGGPEEVEAAAEAAAAALGPPSDLHGSARYRAGIARVCVRRALARALNGPSRP